MSCCTKVAIAFTTNSDGMAVLPATVGEATPISVILDTGAGLAVLARFRADGLGPRRTIKLFGLRGEESARFGKAYMGSSALFGKLTAADLAPESTGARGP